MISARMRVPASMTIEAALCLPLFVFFAAALMEPVRCLDRQRQIQTTLESCCEDLTWYAYVKKDLEAPEEQKETEGLESDQFLKAHEKLEETGELYALMEEAVGGLWLGNRLAPCMSTAKVKKTEAKQEGEDILLAVEYLEPIPFLGGLAEGLRLQAAAKRRMWTGLSGKLRTAGEAAEKEADGMETEWVYVGSGMSRYHLYRDCHYISNQYETISAAEAAQRRSIYGKRLMPCARCGNGAARDPVYITAAGKHYHYSKACPAMAAYVRRVLRTEVEHLGVCSYCQRMEEAQ